jgi:hypothetical protein
MRQEEAVHAFAFEDEAQKYLPSKEGQKGSHAWKVSMHQAGPVS